MKGTEGIDYVITECGHCKGTGKCTCYDCFFKGAIRAIKKGHEYSSGMDSTEDGRYYWEGERDNKIKYFKEAEFAVVCEICKGVGKVIFWREEPSNGE